MRKRHPRQQNPFPHSGGGCRFLFIRAKNDMIPLQHRKHRIKPFLSILFFLLPYSFLSLTLDHLFIVFFYHFNSSSTFVYRLTRPPESNRSRPFTLVFFPLFLR